MTRRNDDELALAFEAVLSAEPEPPMEDLTDKAVAGGRRALRLRRTALATAFAATCVAATAVGVLLTGTDSTPRPDRPEVPAKSPSPTHSTTPPVQLPRPPQPTD